jgi:hypothetical protein
MLDLTIVTARLKKTMSETKLLLAGIIAVLGQI